MSKEGDGRLLRVFGLWLPVALAMGVVAGFAAYATVVSPRPYSIFECDVENSYYYWIRGARYGLPQAIVTHPGTPVVLLGRVLMEIASDRIEDTQRFVNVFHAVAAALTCLAMAVFDRVCLRRLCLGWRVLTLGSIVCWPSFLTYLNYFGADALTPAVGLLTLACYDLSLSQQSTTGRALFWRVVTGLLLGLGVAVKVTFLPFAAVLCAADALRMWGGGARTLRFVRAVSVLPLSCGVSFALWTLPVWSRLPYFVMRTLYNPIVRPADENGWSLAGRIVGGFRSISSLHAIFVPLVCAIGLALAGRQLVAAVLARLAGGSRIGAQRDQTDDADRANDILAGMGALALAYCVLSAENIYADPGHNFRTSAACALFIPWVLRRMGMLASTRTSGLLRWSGVAALVLGLGMTADVVRGHITLRNRWMREHSAMQAAVRAAFADPSSATSRIAFWDGSPADLFGDASFHFWGNYRYAHGRFDADLLRAFPTLTFLNLRDFQENATPEGPASSAEGRQGADRGFVREGARALKRLVSRWCPLPPKSGELYTGQAAGRVVDRIVFPVREAQAELGLSGVQTAISRIRQVYPDATVSGKCVGSQDWVEVMLPPRN